MAVRDIIDKMFEEGFEFSTDYANSLVSEYDSEAVAREGMAEKIASYESNLKERDATISELKARNYDLLVQLPSNQAEDPESGADDDNDTDIDDLFE